MVNISFQTFFRGTRIRYFEVKSQVASHQTIHSTGSVSTASSLGETSPVSVIHRMNGGFALGSSAIDLGALQYIYHFTTTACITSPKDDERSLHQELALLLGKPNEMQDVHSVLSAIALLADIASNLTSSAGIDWVEIIQWLHTASEYYHLLILNQNIAALIVLSY